MEQPTTEVEKRVLRAIQGHIAANGPEAIRRSGALFESVRELIAAAERIGEAESWAVIVTDPTVETSRADRRTVYGPYDSKPEAEAASVALLADINRMVEGESADSPWATPCTAEVAAFFDDDDRGPLTDRETFTLDMALSAQQDDPTETFGHYERSLLRRRKKHETAAA